MNRDEWNERYRAVPVLWPIDPGPFLGAELNGEAPGVAWTSGPVRVTRAPESGPPVVGVQRPA